MSRFFSQKKDTPQTKTQTKTKSVFSSNDFPDLSTNTCPSTKISPNTHKMNYKNKVEIVEPEVVSNLNHGHISLFYDKITRRLHIEKEKEKENKKETSIQKPLRRPSPPSFEKLVTHWEKWYDDYIELYGEDIYENVHLYPFYNYNYFNELDEIFYRELEELEKLEESEYEEYDDYA